MRETLGGSRLTVHGIHLLKRLSHGERGSIIALLALGLTVLVGSVAMVTDVGLIFHNRLEVANAADAAALAGIQALPVSEEQAISIARDYGARNDVAHIEVQVSPDKRELEVRASREINLFFARVLGYFHSDATAVAKVRLEPLTGVTGIAPLGVEDQTFKFGEPYVLKYAASDSPEGEYHSGWLGILALQGPGAKLYEEDLMHGFDQEIKTGDILNIQTGNVSGKTKSAIDYRIDQCKHLPYCTVESHHKDCPRILLVPVVEPYTHKKVRVKGFAAFFVEAVAGMGNKNYIRGSFIYHTISGKSSETGSDNGLYVPRLIQ